MSGGCNIALTTSPDRRDGTTFMTPGGTPASVRISATSKAVNGVSDAGLRITAQLLDKDGGGHVWGEKYDCDAEEIFDLQDEITRNVVSSIAPQIELAELERSRRLSDSGLTAYELALKAQALTYDAVRAADPVILDQAMSNADAALALDSRNIHALWTKSLAYLFQYMYRWRNDPDAALEAVG